MYNEIVIATVDYFKATGNVLTQDKNEKPNVILVPICGKMPNQAQVLAGSVAIGNGILNTDGSISSKLQMLHITERPSHETYGRQFSVTKLGEVTPKELVGLQKELGKGFIEQTSVPAVMPNTGDNVNDITANGATPALNTSAAPELAQ